MQSAESPPLECVPAAHTPAHVIEAPVSVNLPAGQFWQLEFEASALKVPAAQAEHTAEPAGADVPGAHV